MATNPWLVESVQSFLYLKCPECIFDIKYENEDMFQYHALEKHPLSNVLFGNEVKVNPKAIENQILDPIKKENHDEFDDNYNSFSPPLPELKVEFSEEGEENKVFDHEGIQKDSQC